ncbi:MAG TPA: EcsC family protein [Actinopolymorphaceae bacterium]
MQPDVNDSKSGSRNEDARRERVANALLDRLLGVGIDGAGKVPSAQQTAERALRRADGDIERAVDDIVSAHTRLAGVGGFVTGFGGFVTLAVALPVNVVEFYIIATRMVAAIAAVRGHDVRQDQVRTSVLLTLAGNDATKVLAKAGVGAVSGRLTSLALRPLPTSALMVINKGVAFRLIVRAGQRTLVRFGRMIPLVGGVLGGAFDVYLVRRIAKNGKRQFPRLGHVM